MPLPNHLRESRAELERVSRQHTAGIYYGDHRLLCRLLGEFPAFVDTRDLMLGPRLALDGYWEAWVSLALARYLQTGMWCVDVGANYGYYTLLMAAACQPSGKVVACEPHPLLHEIYLPQNRALNGLHHAIEVCGKVVGDRDAAAIDFVIHDDDFATSALVPWAYARRCQTISVGGTTLDSLCADWPRLDLVKIDAEGAERLVWQGMQETLGRFKNVAVVIELHLQRDRQQALSMLQEIARSDFPLRHINYQGEIVPVSADTILAQPHEHWTLWLQRR